MLIVFDGIDRAGKTTHMKLVTKWLSSVPYEFTSVREPGGTIIAEKLRRIFLQKRLDPMLQLFLVSTARLDLTLALQEKSGLILCDRFVDSTYAYQGQFLDESIIDKVVALTCKLMPDFVFLFLNTYAHNINEMDEMAHEHREEIIARFKKRVQQVPARYFIVPDMSIKKQQAMIRQKIGELLWKC